MKKYLYIDDESMDSIEPIISGLNRSGRILVERMPLDKNEKIEDVYQKLRELQYDGIIVDLMLNGNGPFRIACNSNSIVQYVRDLAERNELKFYPVVLCSTDKQLQNQLHQGYTSSDLYDHQFSKDFSIDYEREAVILESLAEGYDLITNNNNISEILSRDISNLDTRPFEPFIEGKIDVKQCADLIIKDLFIYSGLLISEDVFCARLGIAKNGSYKEVLSLFDSAKYIGVFKEVGDFYWSDIVCEIFYETFHVGLASLDNEEKIKLLHDYFKDFELVEASLAAYNNSKRFWTICVKTNEYIDPMEGYRLKEKTTLKPWQEPRYVSFGAISNGDVDKAEVLTVDMERFDRKVEYIKKSLDEA